MENNTWYAPRRFELFCLAQVEFLNPFQFNVKKNELQ